MVKAKSKITRSPKPRIKLRRFFLAPSGTRAFESLTKVPGAPLLGTRRVNGKRVYVYAWTQ